MINHNCHHSQHPSPPIDIPFYSLLGDGNDFWTPSSLGHHGADMHATYSHLSEESGMNSSPRSYQDPLLYDAQCFHAASSTSPTVGTASHFEQAVPLGISVFDDQPYDRPPQLDDQDLFVMDPQCLVNNPAAEMDYSQNSTMTGDSYRSEPSFEAALDAVFEAPPGEKPGYRCPIEDCTSKGRFSRKTDLTRHLKSIHYPEPFDCEFGWCGRVGEEGFVRKDHYKEHLREYHRKDIPKAGKNRSKR